MQAARARPAQALFCAFRTRGLGYGSTQHVHGPPRAVNAHGYTHLFLLSRKSSHTLLQMHFNRIFCFRNNKSIKSIVSSIIEDQRPLLKISEDC